MKKVRIFYSILIIASLVFAIGCTKKRNKLDYGLNIKETLRVNLASEPPTLDWNKATDTTSNTIISNIMDGLTRYNLKDPNLSLKPALATSWKSTDRAKKWTFVLRKGVKWTDGVEFTAQHVIDSWERLLNPKTASGYAYFLYGIKNARTYNNGKLKDFSKVGVRVNEKGELVVDLEAPQSYFPMLLTHSSTFPIRKDLIKKYGDDNWAKPGSLVSLGAYFLKIWEHDKAIVIERNLSYYSKPAHIKNILAYMINESSTAISLFDAGRIDIQNSLPTTELSILKNRKEYQSVSLLSIYYYGFNTKKPPLNNLDVRKAISMSIDRDEVVKLAGGGETPLTSWIPLGMFGYEPKRGIKFNPKEARRLLAKAGFGPKKKFPKLVIGFNTNENHKRIAENIQAQIKRNLGINLELKNEEWKVYLNSLRLHKYDIYRIGWLADFPDPDNFYNLLASYSENNYTNWGNKKFDKLVEAGVSETDRDKRKSIYSQANEILTEKDIPVIPIMSSVKHSLVSERVINYPRNSMNVVLFKEVSLKE